MQLGYFTVPINQIPEAWDVYPEWHELKAGSGVPTEYNKVRFLNKHDAGVSIPKVPNCVMNIIILQGKVLCSFELVPIGPEFEERVFFDDIRVCTCFHGWTDFLQPSTFPGTVHFFLVGIRLFQAANAPEVDVR